MANVDPAEFERIVADYYRRHGYQVDECGTGRNGRSFDGGIDLKLYRDGEYTIVQCKRENALQVPHNVGHELLGILATQKADRAIVVITGEFTRAARESAAKDSRLQLIDGDALRAMLGALPDVRQSPPRGADAGGILSHVGERLLSAAEDRIRYGGRRVGGRRSRVARMGVGLLLAKVLVPLLGFLLLYAWFTAHLRDVASDLQAQTAARNAATRAAAFPVPPAPEARAGLVDATDAPKPPTAAEIREAGRRADEAMRVLAPNTRQVEYMPARD